MQHREWNPKTFFRNMPDEVITALEAASGIPLSIGLAESLPDRAYRGFQALSDDVRLALQSQLTLVNDLCTTHARPYLSELARFVWRGDVESIDAIVDWSVQELALRLFLADQDRFVETHGEFVLDSMESFTEFRGEPVRVSPSAEKKERMKLEMVRFARSRAEGVQCQVEDYETHEKVGLFIYREDELRQVDEFDGGVVLPKWQRSVLRIAALFYPATGSLLIKAPTKAEREELRDLFAAVMIGDPTYFDHAMGPVYGFGPLRDPSFAFPTRPSLTIDSVSVVQIVVRSSHVDIERHRVDCREGMSVAEVHRAARAAGIDLTLDPIEEVCLRFLFAGKGRSRTRTVRIRPQGTNLADIPRDRIIRECLREWRFDDTRSLFAVDFSLEIPATVA